MARREIVAGCVQQFALQELALFCKAPEQSGYPQRSFMRTVIVQHLPCDPCQEAATKRGWVMPATSVLPEETKEYIRAAAGSKGIGRPRTKV